MSAKERFQQLAAQEEAERKRQEQENARKEEERRKKAAGGVTKIGTTKGQIKAFATAFEAIADGFVCLCSYSFTPPQSIFS